MKKNKKYILHIINKLAGNISPADQKKLKTWLAADEKNQEQYDLIAKIVSTGHQMEFPADPDIHDAWSRFEFPDDSLSKGHTFSQKRLASGEWIVLLLQPRRLAYITLFIIMIVASAFWYYHSTYSIETLMTANRQHKKIALSDGTMVYLNSATKLSYPKKFSEAIRKVTLKGEAFFNVTKSKSPFIVQTSEGTIAVLGTRFDIWARNQQTRVIVEEGAVRLEAKDSAHSVILTKDLMSEINQNRAPTKPHLVNAEELLGWRTGNMVFRSAMLSEIAGEICRYYDVNIKIENPELETKTLTAIFDRLPLNKVLYSICSALDIKYRYENGSYIFYKPESNNQ